MSTNVVGDPTDKKETLRPNLHSEIGIEDHYESLFCSEFNPIINLSSDIDRVDPFAIWGLFFPREYLGDIVVNTNKRGQFL